MSCLKLYTGEFYTTLKVVYNAYPARVLEEQNEKNNTTFLEVVYKDAQSGGGNGTMAAAMTVAGGLAISTGPVGMVAAVTILAGAAAVVVVQAAINAGKGNAGYPGPLSYTHQDPSQHAPNNSMGGIDPEKPNSSNPYVRWLFRAVGAYEAYDAYQENLKDTNFGPTFNAVPQDNTYVSPSPFKPR